MFHLILDHPVSDQIVLFLSIVKNLPEWLPGTGFKKIAREWAGTVSDFYDKPYAFVKQQMVRPICSVKMPS